MKQHEYETLCSYTSTDVKQEPKNVSLFPEQHFGEAKDGNVCVFLQLSSCKVHVCLSMGYLVRSMLQATVVVILQRKT